MKILKKELKIAIDGPVGSGKSLAAELLAKKLGIFYLNTGATFRVVALVALKKGLDFRSKEVHRILKKKEIEIKIKKSGDYRVILEGRNVTRELFTSEVAWGASCVATLPEIRKILTRKWREIVKNKPFIAEGRDMALIFPQADLKVFMTADCQVRAKRIQKKLKEKELGKSFDQVLQEIKARDHQDMYRKINPLKFSSKYWLLDTSDLTPEEEIEIIIRKLKKMKLVC